MKSANIIVFGIAPLPRAVPKRCCHLHKTPTHWNR